MTDTATRLVNGRSTPSAGVWDIDPSHSSVGFVVRHMMVAKTRGTFGTYTSDLVIAENPVESTLSVEIDVASVDTKDEGRNGHLLSPDFFDVATYPKITFVSTAVEPGKSDDKWNVTGDLTIHGVTKPVVLEVEFDGVAEDPWGNDRAIYEAETEIDREDFGLTWNQPLAGGGVLVGKKVKIELTIETVRRASEA